MTKLKAGFDGGVRLGSALYAMSAFSKGDDERMRKAIRDFAANDQNLAVACEMLWKRARLDSVSGWKLQ